MTSPSYRQWIAWPAFEPINPPIQSARAPNHAAAVAVADGALVRPGQRAAAIPPTRHIGIHDTEIPDLAPGGDPSEQTQVSFAGDRQMRDRMAVAVEDPRERYPLKINSQRIVIRCNPVERGPVLPAVEIRQVQIRHQPEVLAPVLRVGPKGIHLLGDPDLIGIVGRATPPAVPGSGRHGRFRLLQHIEVRQKLPLVPAAAEVQPPSVLGSRDTVRGVRHLHGIKPDTPPRVKPVDSIAAACGRVGCSAEDIDAPIQEFHLRVAVPSRHGRQILKASVFIDLRGHRRDEKRVSVHRAGARDQIDGLSVRTREVAQTPGIGPVGPRSPRVGGRVVDLDSGGNIVPPIVQTAKDPDFSPDHRRAHVLACRRHGSPR